MKIQRNPSKLRKKGRVNKKQNISEGYFLTSLGVSAFLPLVGIILALFAKKKATDASDKQLASVALGTSLLFLVLQMSLIAWAVVSILKGLSESQLGVVI